MIGATLSRPQVFAWRNAVLVTFGLSGLALASWLSRVPAVRDELGVSTTTLGLVLFGIAAGSMGGLTLSSHVIARLGTGRTVLASMGLGVLGLPVAAVGALVASPLLCFAGLVVFGFGNGMCDVAMNVAGAANERALGRTVMPLFHAMFSGGTVIGVGLGAVAELWHVPILLHVSAIAAITIAAAALAVRRYESETHDAAEHAAHDDPTAGWRGRLAAWLEPRTLLIGVIVLGMAFAEGSANDWLPLAMVDGHGLDHAGGAMVLGVFLASMTAGRLGGGPLLDRFGRVPVLRASAASAAAGLALIIFMPSTAMAIAGAVLWGLGSALGFPVGMSVVADDPRRAAARVSAVATIAYLAFLAGPPVIGVLADHVGLLRALTVVLVLVALAGLTSGAARETRRAAPERESAEAPAPHG